MEHFQGKQDLPHQGRYLQCIHAEQKQYFTILLRKQEQVFGLSQAVWMVLFITSGKEVFSGVLCIYLALCYWTDLKLMQSEGMRPGTEHLVVILRDSVTVGH